MASSSSRRVGVRPCGAALLLLALTAPSVLAAETVLIVLDASHSMGQFLYNKRKIDIARENLMDVLAKQPPETTLGLRVLAHEIALDPCNVTALIVPFTAGSPARVSGAVRTLKAVGTQTPLARALEQAKRDLTGIDQPRRVVLLTDGIETCKGDPIRAARELGEMGVKVDVVGIGSARRVAQFEAIAAASGGSYAQARSDAGMRQALAGLFGPQATASAGAGAGSARGARGAGAGRAASASSTLPASAPPAARSVAPPRATSPTPYAIDLEVILDSSGSMAGRIGGQTKLELARRALGSALGELAPDAAMVAFRAYGHRVSRDDKARSCEDSELVEPFAFGNRNVIVGRAAALGATGQTPIAFSLDAAGRDLRPRRGFKHFVLLLSDGIETCGGDPAAVAAKLRAEGIDVVVHTVGFDVDNEAERQLRAIAAGTGGRYISAPDYQALAEGLRTITAEVTRARATVEAARDRNPVKGGPSKADATPLQPGWYTLSDPVPQRQYVYFKIPLKSGQLLTYSARVTALVGTLAGSVAVVPFDEQGREIRNARASAVAELGREATARLLADRDRLITLGIGSDYNETHRDSLFTISVDDCFDGPFGRDTPADGSGPLPTGGLTGWLGLDDAEDRFLLDTSTQGRWVLRFEPDDPAFAASLVVMDDKGRVLATSPAGARGQAALNVTVPTSGSRVYVALRDRNVRSEQRLTRYGLHVERR